MKTYYRRNLPHFQPIGSTFFVTFRLADSVPLVKIEELKRHYEQCINEILKVKDKVYHDRMLMDIRKEYLDTYDEVLHSIKTGPHYLKDDRIRKIVSDELKKHDGKLYELIAYCIMSNHVHVVIDTEIQIKEEEVGAVLGQTFKPLDKILKQIKGATARYINIYLNKSGSFWERESFDIFIRNEAMLNDVIAYTLNNPVKAGLVSTWEDYQGNYYIEEK